MTENEARELGYISTGVYYDKYEEQYWNKCKQEAAMIKKTFKGADYKVVTLREKDYLGNYSRCIMGNKIFIKVKDEFFNHYTEKRIASYEERKAALVAEYEKKLQELEDSYKKDLDFMQEFENLKK